jgi:superfamily I DNA/RNA helicase
MGKLVRITTISELNMDEGTWLILAQAGYHLQPVAQDLKSFGYLFNYRGVKSVPEKIVQAVNGWEQLRKGHQISGEIARKIYSFMSVKNRITRGFKKLSGLDDTDFVTLEDLQSNHGLLATDQMIWHDAMDKLPEIDRAYIVAMLRRGEKFNKEPRITVSTIHGSKGGEADNVVIFTDLSPAADAEMNINPDDLHRLFYVAVTRTKENLYIVESEDVTRSYDL